MTLYYVPNDFIHILVYKSITPQTLVKQQPTGNNNNNNSHSFILSIYMEKKKNLANLQTFNYRDSMLCEYYVS